MPWNVPATKLVDSRHCRSWRSCSRWHNERREVRDSHLPLCINIHQQRECISTNLKPLGGNLLWHDLIKGLRFLKTASPGRDGDGRYLCRKACMKYDSVLCQSESLNLILSAENCSSRLRPAGEDFCLKFSFHSISQT